MTDKQTIFIAKYLTHFNATRAAIEAGYSEDSARSIASELLTKPDIIAAKEKRVAEIVAQTDEKRAKLILFWDSVIDDPEGSESAKQKASDSMAKYLAMFTENINIGGEIVTAQKFIVEGNESD